MYVCVSYLIFTFDLIAFILIQMHLRFLIISTCNTKITTCPEIKGHKYRNLKALKYTYCCDYILAYPLCTIILFDFEHEEKPFIMVFKIVISGGVSEEGWGHGEIICVLTFTHQG